MKTCRRLTHESLHVPGVDPDLLVFGKYFTSNVRVLPHHYSRVNASEPLPSDKRQFIHPPPPLPLTSAPTVKPSTTAARVLTTSALQSTSQPSTVSTTTTALSSTPAAPPAALWSHAQTTTQSTPSPTATTFGPYNAQTTPVSPSTSSLEATTTTQPSTSTSTNQYTTTFSQSATSPPTSTALMGNIESSKQYPNDTKGSLGRNHTAGSEGDQGAGGEDTLGGLGPGWHVAAHTLLVAVAICITVLLSCCCSILLVVSWRGQRKRMGRYRTSWRGKRGSMRLIKYVLVRESS